MNTPIKDGGSAFPVSNWQAHGLSMRDYFAAKAMQGFAADPGVVWPNGIAGMAACAYQWADAMIKARSV